MYSKLLPLIGALLLLAPAASAEEIETGHTADIEAGPTDEEVGVYATADDSGNVTIYEETNGCEGLQTEEAAGCSGTDERIFPSSGDEGPSVPELPPDEVPDPGVPELPPEGLPDPGTPEEPPEELPDPGAPDVPPEGVPDPGAPGIPELPGGGLPDPSPPETPTPGGPELPTPQPEIPHLP